MDSYSVMAVLSATDSGFTSTMKGAGKTLDSLDNSSNKTRESILKIAGTTAVFKAMDLATNTLVNSLGKAIDRYDTMNRFPRIMEQIGFSTEESGRSVEKLSRGIDGLPTSLDAITGSTQKIALLTGNLDKATSTSIALNNAFLASGASTADAERGLIQYTQMLSKGTVDMQSWRTLQETMGVGLNELAKSFGYAGESAQNDLYAALQSGTITFDQLNGKLIELDGGVNGFAERAKTASAGIRTSMQNVGTAVVKGVTTIIGATDQMLKDNGFPSFAEMIDGAKGIISAGAQTIATNIGTAGKVVNTLSPVLKSGAVAWLAYEAAIASYSAVQQISTAILKKKEAIEAAGKAMKTASQASKLLEAAEKATAVAVTAKEKATTAARIAETLSAKAEEASAKATKAKAAADKLAKEAAKAKAAAAKAGGASATLNAQAETLGTAATKAKANADELSAVAEAKKSVAVRASTVAQTTDTAATTADTAATAANAAANEANNVAISAKTLILGVLSGEIGIVTAAQTAWNAAMTANPIGAIVALAATLGIVLAGVGKAIQSLDKGYKSFENAHEKAMDSVNSRLSTVQDAIDAYNDQTDAAENSAKANEKLAKEITDLASKESLSSTEKATLQSKIESLNSSIGGLNLAYDEEGKALNIGSDALAQRVDAYQKVAEAQKAQENRIPLLAQQEEAEKALTEAVKQREAIEKQMNEDRTMGVAQMGEYNKKLQEVTAVEEEARAQKEELSAKQKELDAAVVAGAQAQADAVSAGAEKQMITFDMLSESQQAAVESMQSTWQSYQEQATNMFDVLSDKSELSVAKMTENMQENQRVIGEWADNIGILADRGIDEGLLAKLREAGPESAGYVKAMVQASDAELQQMSESYRSGAESATKAFGATIANADMSTDIMGFVTKTKDTLASQVSAADFTTIGQNVGQGLEAGITSSSAQAAAASTSMAQGVENATRDALQTHSPSALFQSIGVDTVQGFIIGVQGQSGIAVSTMTSVMTAAGNAAKQAINNSMKEMPVSMASGFTKMGSIAQAGMMVTAKAIEAGMKSGNSVVKNGTKEMNVSVQSNMRTILSTTTSSMSSFVMAVNTGMNTAKAYVLRGGASMMSAVSSLSASFQASGYNASLGLARGVNAGAGSAIAAAQRLANTVANTINSALKIKSPSRVTMESGEFVGDGLAIGILNRAKDVKNAALKLAEAAAPANPIANRIAYAGQVASGFNSTYTERVGNTYTIIVPLEIEGREIAKATATYTQEELNKMETRNSRKCGRR